MSASLLRHLSYREKKARWILKRSESSGQTIIVFRCNIPGEDKQTWWAKKLFLEGCQALKDKLSKEEFHISDLTEQICSEIDCTEFIMVLESPEKDSVIKKLCMALEIEHALGRVFDIDVYGPGGVALQREQFGEMKRTCFICHKPAFECSRNRTHTLDELKEFLIFKAETLQDTP